MSDPSNDSRELDRLWNDLVAGRVDAAGYGVGPDTAETLHAFRALVVPPPQVSRDRVDGRVLAAIERKAEEAVPMPHVITLTSPSGARGAGTAVDRPTLRPSRRSRWSEMPLAALATAALIALVLLGSFTLLRGSLHFATWRELLAIVPANDSAPGDDLLPGIAADSILMQATLMEIAPNAGWEGLERATLPPRAVRPLGEKSNEGEGPIVFRVESGELTVEADAPFTVTRSGERTPIRIPPETPVVLEADDQGFTAYGVASRWRNDGTVPVVVLDAMITNYGAFPDFAGPDAERVDLVSLIEQPMITAPTTPLALTVQQQTLAAGDRLVPSQIPGLVGFYVDSGTLRVVNRGEAGADSGSFDIEAGSGRSFGPSGYKTPPESWTLESADGEPATLLLMTVTAANPLQATPLE